MIGNTKLSINVSLKFRFDISVQGAALLTYMCKTATLFTLVSHTNDHYNAHIYTNRKWYILNSLKMVSIDTS